MVVSSNVVFVLNGPNLNSLGTREPEVYGTETLKDIAARLSHQAAATGHEIDFRQSNHEGVLIDWLYEAQQVARGIIFNPGAYSHSSIALRDAIAGISVPVYEVHISNIYARETFRHHSHLSAVCAGVICGLGTRGYDHALAALTDRLADDKTPDT